MSFFINRLALLFTFKYCLFATLFFVAKSFGHSAPLCPLDSDLIQAFQKLEAQDKLDGELLIANRGRIVFSAKSKEIKQASAPAQFMIGSLSKQFFAAALLKALYEDSPQLTEEEKIKDVKRKLHQPITLFLKKDSFWNSHKFQWSQKISLHQLLNHTSGLPNYTDTQSFTEILDDGKTFFEHPHSKKELLQLIANQPLLFVPGTEYSYSNTGYVLIAEIIELISGMPVSDYLQQKIFTPLHMQATFNPKSGQWSTLKKQDCFFCLVPQWTYDPKTDCQKMRPNTSMIDISNAIGTGSIISTAQDLLKWNIALHQHQILFPPALYELMVTAGLDDYGYGIGIERSVLGPILGHQGSIDAFQAALFYLPSHQLSIIYLTNTAYDWSPLQEEKIKRTRELEGTDEIEEVVNAELLQKYPDKRGFNSLLSLIEENLFVNEDP